MNNIDYLGLFIFLFIIFGVTCSFFPSINYLPIWLNNLSLFFLVMYLEIGLIFIISKKPSNYLFIISILLNLLLLGSIIFIYNLHLSAIYIHTIYRLNFLVFISAIVSAIVFFSALLINNFIFKYKEEDDEYYKFYFLLSILSAFLFLSLMNVFESIYLYAGILLVDFFLIYFINYLYKYILHFNSFDQPPFSLKFFFSKNFLLPSIFLFFSVLNFYLFLLNIIPLFIPVLFNSLRLLFELKISFYEKLRVSMISYKLFELIASFFLSSLIFLGFTSFIEYYFLLEVEVIPLFACIFTNILVNNHIKEPCTDKELIPLYDKNTRYDV